MEAVESSLREFWSLRKYNFDMGEAGQREHEGAGVNATMVDEAVCSPFFWAYRQMWEILISVIVRGMAFFANLARATITRSSLPRTS